MRAPSLVCAALAAVAALAGGCGGDASPRATRGAAPVRITLSSPGDLASTRSDTLTVSGSVSPADASVRVLGRPADVVAGAFSARVPLRPGANVIDLAATAPVHGPALTAVRVTREMPIRVPDLEHLTPDDAAAKLAALGLRLRTRDDGGLFEGILPGTPGVCAQRPAAGTEVRAGARVLVLVAKRC
jgi:hypothetical protein